MHSIEFPIKIYTGKVKDVFSLSRFGGVSKILLVATDRISAFDQILEGQSIPYKGQVITALSEFWFQTLNDIIANHFIDRIGTNTLLVRSCEIIPVEVIVRSCIVGSLWALYESGEREIYGHSFPDGLQKGDLLPEPIITPTTKAAAGDEPLELDDPIKRGLVGYMDWEYIKEVSLELFNVAQKLTADKGLELVDWKLEFGRLNDGTIILADEMGTPDSSRFLVDGNHLDKELIRFYIKNSGITDVSLLKLPLDLITKVSMAYQLAMSLITGKHVVPYSTRQVLCDIAYYAGDL